MTKIPPRQHLLFWADAAPKRGNFHLNFELDSIGSNWVALYDGNAIDLIDSISIPVLPADCSYALALDGIKGDWSIVGQGNTYVTPSTNNKTLDTNEKIDGFKMHDPHGFAMSIMAMLLVFFGLLSLYISFYFIGKSSVAISRRRAMKSKSITNEQEAKEKKLGEAPGEVFAAIAMAMHEAVNMHDEEDTVLTINRVRRSYSPWSSKIYTLREIPKK